MSRSIASLIALALAACSADLDAGGDFPTDRGGEGGMGGDMGGRDLGPDGCPPGQIDDGITCIEVPADPCALTDPLLGPGCVDVDGDCFPDKCEGDFPLHLRDCDDSRADRRPGLIERCDGIDNDCDGVADDGLDLGMPCAACDREGVLECGPDGEAVCSVAAGQSDERLEPEACDGLDQDCDGQIDEGCLMDLSAAQRAHPRWCGDRVLFVRGGALYAFDLQTRDEHLIDDGPAAEPTCTADRDAWLRAESCAGGDATAPRVCAGAQLMLRDADGIRPLAPFGDLGAPAIGADGIYLHEGAPAPVLLRAPFDSMPADVLAEDVADPTAPVADLVIARAFRDGQPVMEGVGINQPSRTLDSPGIAPPGRPARDPDLIAWIAGAAPVLWVLPADRLGQGVQVGPALAGRPWVAGGSVWWLAADGLQRFDAATGRVERLSAEPIAPDRLDITAAGRVAIVDEGLRFWPTDPTRFATDPTPPADGGVSDAGPADGGVDGGGVDGGVDAGRDGGPIDGGVADAGPPPQDAGLDAAPDAAMDATADLGTDAAP